MDVKTLFEALVRENTGMLMAYIRAGIRDEHAADDVYQETVLAAWKRLDDYDSQKPLGPGLSTSFVISVKADFHPVFEHFHGGA